MLDRRGQSPLAVLTDAIATGIADSLDILVAAARKSPRGQGRSVVTEMTSHATQRRHGRG